MFFAIENKYKWDKNYFEAKIKRNALKIIRIYKTGASELALNEYLTNKYNKSLKQICKALIWATELKTNTINNDCIVLFKNKEFDDLAELITYGDAKLPGSKILRTAFTWKY